MRGYVHKNETKNGKSWYYTVDVNQPGEKRKQKKKGGFKTQKIAQAALTEILHQTQEGTYREPSKVLYKDFLIEWLSVKKMNLAPNTYSNYKFLIGKWIIPFLGHKKIRSIETVHIDSFLADLKGLELCKGKNDIHKYNLSNKTLSRIFALVKQSLDLGVTRRHIKINPTSKAERPKVKERKVQVWNVDEVLKFIYSSQDVPHFITFILALNGGLRQGEALGLTWRNVDFNKNSITILQTLSHKGNKIQDSTKTESSYRTVILDKVTMNFLKKQKQLIESYKIQSGNDFEDNDLVNSTVLGKPLNPRNVLRTLYNLSTKYNLPKISFHDLRHTHASLLLAMNIHPKVVSERLGHKDIKITMNLYSHLYPTMQEETAESFGQFMFSNTDTNKIKTIETTE